MSDLKTMSAAYIINNTAKAQDELLEKLKPFLMESLTYQSRYVSEVQFHDQISAGYRILAHTIHQWPNAYRNTLVKATTSRVIETLSHNTVGEAELKKHLDEFFFIIKNKEYVSDTSILKDLIAPKTIYGLIHKTLAKNQIQHAESLLSLFTTPSSRNITTYDLNLVQWLFERKNQVAVDFLMKYFDGWEHESVLGNFLPYMDMATLDVLFQKTGTFNSKRLKTISKNTVDRIAQHLIVEFMEKYCHIEQYNSALHNAYVAQLENNSTTREQTRKFITQFMTQNEYLSSWYRDNEKQFFKGINLFIKHDLIGVEDIMKFITEKLSQHTLNGESYKILNTFLNEHTIKTHDYPQFVTQMAMSENESIAITFIDNNLAQIRQIKAEVKYQEKKYASIDDFLMQTGNLSYLMTRLAEVPQKEKENLAKMIELQVSRKQKYYDTPNFTPEKMEAYYLYTVNKLGIQQAFKKWFLCEHIENNMARFFKSALLKKMAQNNVTLSFDLNSIESNPLYLMLNYPSVREDIKNKRLIYNEVSSLSYEVSEFFQHRFIFTNQGYMQKFILENGLWSQHTYEGVMTHKPAVAKKFLGLFGGHEEKPELQLVLRDGRVFVVDNPAEIYVPEMLAVESADTHNNFGGLMIQAQNDMQKVQQTIEKYAAFDLNLEVKIRAERLIFNQVTFLESVKHSLDELDTQDTVFLKNNLGRYLIQCLEVYGKSISKYEKLLNGDNKNFLSHMDEFEKSKNKLDAEALKQIDLLEKELELVKEHILNQFNQDLLRDMRVSTRVLENKIENNHEQKLVKIVKS